MRIGYRIFWGGICTSSLDALLQQDIFLVFNDIPLIFHGNIAKPRELLNIGGDEPYG